MKHWQETAEIFRRLEALEQEGRRAALATVVHIDGSAYRRPGAKFLVEDDGSTLGSVSGGCLEGDVREIGLRILRGEEGPRLLHYDTGADEDTVWGFGLGCEGEVMIFVEAADSDSLGSVADRVRYLLRGQMPVALSTVVERRGGAADGAIGATLLSVPGAFITGKTGDGELDRSIIARADELLDERRSELYEVGGHRVFTEVLLPPPWLVVCGAGDDAIPLVREGHRVGFRVAVVDHRPAYLAEERFPDARALVDARPEGGVEVLEKLDEPRLGPDTFVVVKTHNLARDREWTRSLLETEAPYIGLLGPKDRREQILDEVVPEGERGRVYGPVGLDLGAEGPEQVALSIVAELLAVRSGRRPRHLRDRGAPIHADDPAAREPAPADAAPANAAPANAAPAETASVEEMP